MPYAPAAALSANSNSANLCQLKFHCLRYLLVESPILDPVRHRWRLIIRSRPILHSANCLLPCHLFDKLRQGGPTDFRYTQPSATTVAVQGQCARDKHTADSPQLPSNTTQLTQQAKALALCYAIVKYTDMVRKTNHQAIYIES